MILLQILWPPINLPVIASGGRPAPAAAAKVADTTWTIERLLNELSAF
jgi:hypothetical protein